MGGEGGTAVQRYNSTTVKRYSNVQKVVPLLGMCGMVGVKGEERDSGKTKYASP